MILQSKREKRLLSITLLICLLGLGAVGANKFYVAKADLEENWEITQDNYVAKLKKYEEMDPADIARRHRDITSSQALRIDENEAIVKLRIRDELERFLKSSGVSEKYVTTPKDILEDRNLGIQKYFYQVTDLYATMPVLARFLYQVSRESSLMEVEDIKVDPDRGKTNDRFRITMTVSRIVFAESIRENR